MIPLCRSVLALLGLVGAVSWSAAAERVVVLTSYPEEMFARFEAAFERANPDVNVELVWRMPRDALPYLREKAQGSVDVYWAAAYRNFVTLKGEGAWRRMQVDRNAVPGHAGPFPLADPEGRFEAVEMAGFGFATNPGELARRGLPRPQEWSDVADPRYAGSVLLPVPSKVGFAPNLIDTILQAHGWHDGWSLVARIAANGRLFESGSTSIVDEVGAGRAGIGLTIDFFARSAIANGVPIAFHYPSAGGYSAAHVAILRDAPNPAGAQRFVDFLVSHEGQSLLGAASIRKLPVRPDAYTPEIGTKNPFADPDAPALRYDATLGMWRYALVSALFDRLITQRHEALRDAWSALARAERELAASPVAWVQLDAARRCLEALPVSAEEARDPTFLAIFDARRRDAGADEAARMHEASWSEFFDRQTAEAVGIIADARAAAARQ